MTNSIQDTLLNLGKKIATSEYSQRSTYKAKQRINIVSEKNIYYLQTGSVSAYSHNTDLIIYSFKAPEIIGLEKINNLKIIGHLRCKTDCEIFAIPLHEFIKIIESYNLWPCVVDIILGYLIIYHRRDHRINSPTTKDTVIKYLKHIWGLETNIRKKTSIYTHITQRTHISRSFIYKTLQELESEGFIIVRRGILVKCAL